MGVFLATDERRPSCCRPTSCPQRSRSPVQSDTQIQQLLHDAKTFKASFNRPNLFYEVRPKTKAVDADIIRFIKQNQGKSGIVYCLSRKRVEELKADLEALS